MRTGILAGLLFAAAATAGDAPEIVTARLEWEPGSLGSPDFAKLSLSKKLPRGVLPPPGDVPVLFASLPAGEGRPLEIAVDPRPESPRLWIDRDRDGDLQREKPIPLEVDGEWFEGKATLTFPVAGERAPVPAVARFSLRTAKAQSFFWSVKIHRRGTAVLGGRLRRVALRDGSHTLRFAEASGARLLLDLDGDGALDDDEDSPEWIAPGAPFRLLDEGWTYRLPAPGGRTVEFTRLTEVPSAAPRKWKPESPYYRSSATTKKGRPTADLVRAYRALPKDPDYGPVSEILGEACEQGTDEAFAFLKSVAEGAPTERVRGYAVWYMANAAFLPAHEKEMAAFARSSLAEVASNAARTLYTVGHPQAEKFCLDLTSSTHVSVAAEAAYYLACCGTEAARAKVLSLAEGHRAPGVRARAYEGCRTFPDGPPPSLMAATAREGVLATRVRALRDMARMLHPETRAATLVVAASLRKPAAGSEEREPADLRALVDLLTALPDAECTEAALDLAVRGPEGVRARGVDRLALLRSKPALEALSTGLRSGDEVRREIAARALGRIPVSGVAAELMQQLKREKTDAVSVALVEGLGDQGDESVAAALLRAARGKGPLHAAAVRSLARLGLGVPEVRRYLLDILDSGAPEDRIHAVDAVGASGEVALLPRVLPCLDQDAKALRLAAVEVLRRFRVRESVPPLVARLAKETALRVRITIGRVLFELTGANLYDDAALWQRWLAENGATFQVPAEAPTPPDADVAVSSGTFFGIPVETDRVVFVIDRSGSMDDLDAERGADGSDPPTRLETALRQTRSAVARLGRDARANVILFDDKVHAWQKALVPMDSAMRAALEKHLASQKPGTTTNLYDALEAALLDRDVDTVMLLSDGSPNGGKLTETDDILAAVRGLNRTRRIAIHCVSLGTDSELLRRLAAENSGTYVRR